MSEQEASGQDQPAGGGRDLTVAEQALLAGLLSLVEEHAACSAERVFWARVQEVFVWACVHLADKRGTSGEDLMIHPVDVARICTGWRLDTETVCAALLHDAVDGTAESLDKVHAAFGEEIAGLVGGVTKLVRPRFRPRDEAQAESYRKAVVAMGGDIRVVLIKLACRLDRMRRISAMPKQEQSGTARETLDIYAPIAGRLGIHAVEWELEDLSFQTLLPRRYDEIKGLVGQQWAEREQCIKQAGEYLAKELHELGIEAQVSGHVKRFYSIYLEMAKKGREFNEILDLTAMRVIVGSVKDCYGTVGVIHSLWKPLPGRFKDCIAMPKADGCQSLRSTVIGPGGGPLEIQVLTREMHEFAEWIASGGRVPVEGDPCGRSRWFENVLQLPKPLARQQLASDPKAFADTFAESDRVVDEIVVLTPKGDIVLLAAGATALDFAYKIHTEVGHRCVGVKVNGEPQPLRHELQFGDIVEVTRERHERPPRREWLDIVRTEHARKRIEEWFAAERRAL